MEAVQRVKHLPPCQAPHLDREAATRSALWAGELGYFGGGTGGPSTLTGGGGVCRRHAGPGPLAIPEDWGEATGAGTLLVALCWKL